MFDFVSVESVCPQDARKKYEYMSLLKRGLSVRTAKLTYSHGNSVGNLNFIWKIPSAKSDSDIFSQSQRVIEICKQKILSFHTRLMRQTLYSKYGRVAHTLS